MVLVDSSVWIAHLKRPDKPLIDLLEDGEVATHPFVIGELACGSLRRREEFLHLLAYLPKLEECRPDEVLSLIEKSRLWRQGIGWVDTHLVAAALINEVTLYTFDKKLLRICAKFGIAH